MRKLIITLCLAVLIVSTAPFSMVNAAASGAPAQQGQTDQYLWVPGVMFKPRSSLMAYNLESRTFLVSSTRGSTEDHAFTIPVYLPSGTRLLGATFYYFDASARNSRLTLTKVNGAGGQEIFFDVSSSGSAGDGSREITIGAETIGILIDNSNGAYTLNWYPYDDTPDTKLRAVRLRYRLPSALPTADYLFVPGTAANV